MALNLQNLFQHLVNEQAPLALAAGGLAVLVLYLLAVRGVAALAEGTGLSGEAGAPLVSLKELSPAVLCLLTRAGDDVTCFAVALLSLEAKGHLDLELVPPILVIRRASSPPAKDSLSSEEARLLTDLFRLDLHPEPLVGAGALFPVFHLWAAFPSAWRENRARKNGHLIFFSLFLAVLFTIIVGVGFGLSLLWEAWGGRFPWGVVLVVLLVATARLGPHLLQKPSPLKRAVRCALLSFRARLLSPTAPVRLGDPSKLDDDYAYAVALGLGHSWLHAQVDQGPPLQSGSLPLRSWRARKRFSSFEEDLARCIRVNLKVEENRANRAGSHAA